MTNEKTELMTTGNIAKELGVSDTKVKKVIKELGIKPVHYCPVKYRIVATG